MKQPDENKCGMECIRTNTERICVKPENGQCPRCEQLVEEALGRVRQLESTYNQVSKSLCDKENATPDELLKAADQVKTIIRAYHDGRLAILRRSAAHWPCLPREAALRIRNHNYVHRMSEGHASIISDLLEIAADALESVQIPNNTKES